MNSQQPTARLRPFKPVQFGRYTLVAQLAAGGMGEIYLARMEGPQGFEKFCVIKKILPSLAAETDFVERFVNEAKTLVKLSHGSIAQVLDMGLHEGDPYIALEHVDGKDLRKVALRMRERMMPPPLTFALYVMSRLLDALAYAHRKRDDDDQELNLVHRDVSPQNVLVSYEGEVKIIDFGLAKSTLSGQKTNPSIILGKFLYMSPEQARHQKVDRRTDLYSVGLCLYELILGKHPFDDVAAGELMAQVATPDIPTLQSRDPLVPAAVSQMVAKALAVDPDKRFQTAEEFRGKLLGALLEIDSTAGPETVSKFMRETFAAEYQAERRLLATLRDAARPALSRERDETGGEVRSLPRRREPDTGRPVALTEPETPMLSSLRMTSPPPEHAGEAALARLIENTKARPMITPAAARPAEPADLVTEHDIPVIPDEPPVMGTPLEDLLPTHSEPTPVVTAPDAQPEIKPAPIRARPPPSRARALSARQVGPDKTDEMDLDLLPRPAPRRISIWWIAAPIVLATAGATGYFVWDIQRAGLFQTVKVRPPPPPPRPQMIPAPAPSNELPPTEPPDDDMLVPLDSGKKAAHPATRRNGHHDSTLMREWTKTRLAFEDLERAHPCELSSMKLLCSRYEGLKAEVVAADGNAISEDRLLPRVRNLAQLIAQRKASGR